MNVNMNNSKKNYFFNECECDILPKKNLKMNVNVNYLKKKKICHHCSQHLKSA